MPTPTQGFGIFPPYQKILDDINLKLSAIAAGIQKFDVTSFNKIGDITSQINTTKQQITKEINTIMNVHVPQATNSAQIAASAGNPITQGTLIKFITNILVEMQAGIKCIIDLVTIVLQCVAIVTTIALKIAELALYIIMSAGAAALAYLKGKLAPFIAYVNKIKAQMLQALQLQQGTIAVNSILTEMDPLYKSSLSYTPALATYPNYLNNIQTFNTDYAKLLIIKEQHVYGTLDVDTLVFKFVEFPFISVTDMSERLPLKPVPVPAS